MKTRICQKKKYKHSSITQCFRVGSYYTLPLEIQIFFSPFLLLIIIDIIQVIPLT